MCLPNVLGNPSGFGIVWLRTCYDDDDAYARLLGRLNAEMALDSEQNILDDRALYEYGDDWPQIFSVIPEKLLQVDSEYQNQLDGARSSNELRHKAQRDYMAGNFNSNIIEMIRDGSWPSTEYALTEDEKDQAIYKEKTSEIHDWATRNYMFIADETAVETGEVLVVFFDSRRRVVRSNRIDPDEGEPLAGAYFEGIHIRQFWFGEAQIGPDYMPGGVCGPPFAPADD